MAQGGSAMNTKQCGPVTLKADAESGEFRAVFSTLNVIDRDGDVTLPGAFTDGEEVRISFWGHRWQDLPVGKGVIASDDKEAWVDGQFFLDTDAGRETYQTVKNLGSLQEWSYGFDVLDDASGEFEGQKVRFLKSLKVVEVSPVMIGAGVNTRTEAIKAGARHTSKEFEAIQQIHDLAIQLGAKCAEPDDSGGSDEADGQDEAQSGKSRSHEASILAARLNVELLEV
jgi:HK97 family phage prohead protease